MTYAYFEGFTKTYVVEYNIGLGVMEDPYVSQGIVFETDSLEEAKSKAEELKLENNSPKDIKSTWYNNHYKVHVNTLNEKGKELYKEWGKEFDKKLESVKQNPNYREMKVDGNTFSYIYNPLLDG